MRAKKPTVAHLAAQQESFAKALAGISAQLAQITSTSSAAGLGPGPQAPQPKAATSALLSAPIAGKAPPPGSQAKALASLLDRPPRAKAASALPVLAADDGPPTLEGLELDDTAAGHGPVAEAMLLQSRALAQLVSQITQNSVEFGSQASSLSTRGTSSRQRMQAELTLREGHFATG